MVSTPQDVDLNADSVQTKTVDKAPSLENNALETPTTEQSNDNKANDMLARGLTYDSGTTTEASNILDVEVEASCMENKGLEMLTNKQPEDKVKVPVHGTTSDSGTTEASKLSDVDVDTPSLKNNGFEMQTKEQPKDNEVKGTLAHGITYDSGTATESEDEYKIETPENLFSSKVTDAIEESSPENTDKETDSESDEDPRIAIQKRRALSLKFQQEFFAQLRIKEMQDALEAQANARTMRTNNSRRSKIVRRRRTSGDPTFRFGGYIPLEKRRSARLQNINPEFKYTDLPDDDSRAVKRRRFSNDDFSHIEDIVYEPKIQHARRSTQSRPPIIPVEDVTEEMLDNIATKSSAKIHDTDKGTSCHQCRQKTIDTKTCCRNVDCVGVRGQFCGCCIKNRYGEDAAVALLDPGWTCFVCRGVCNCSFCRAKAGKKPTGILTPMVQRHGYNSVWQFLEQAKTKATAKDVRGFTADHAHSKDGTTQRLFCEYKTLSELEDLKKMQMENEAEDEGTFEGLSDNEYGEIFSNKTVLNGVSPQAQSKIEIVEYTEDDIGDNSSDTSNKHSGSSIKISGTLFGRKKNRKLKSSARKQASTGTNLLGFSSDGKQAVMEGGISVPLYIEDL